MRVFSDASCDIAIDGGAALKNNRVMFVGTNVTYLQDSMQPIFSAAKACGIELFWAANFSNYAGDIHDIPVKCLQVPFSRHPLIHADNLRAINVLRQYIRDFDIAGIHCNTPLGSTCARIAAAFEHIQPVLYTAHGLLYYKKAPRRYFVFKAVEWALAHFTDGVVCMNEEDRDAVEKLPLREKKIWKINGVGISMPDLNGFDRCRKRMELGIQDNQVVILCIGRLEGVKDIPTSIEAFGRCDNDSSVMLICGEGHDRDELVELVNKKGLADRVRFLGFRKDVQSIMAASDIYVLSSLHEGLPRSLMEAKQIGMACVVSDARGCIDLVTDNVDGIICRCGDAESFAAALNRLIHNPGLRDSLGFEAAKGAEKYGIEAATKVQTQIYKCMFCKG